MFNLKRKPKPEELAAVTSKCLAIAEGMRRSGKGLEEIQTFLAQTVAVTTDLSSHDAAALVNEIMELFFQSVHMTGTPPAPPADDKPAAGQKAAATKTVGGQTYFDVTPETHSYRVDAPPWKKPVTAPGNSEQVRSSQDDSK